MEKKIEKLEAEMTAVIRALRLVTETLMQQDAVIRVLQAQFPTTTLVATAHAICPCDECKAERAAAEAKTGVS